MNKRYEVKVTQHAEQAMREIVQHITFELLAPEAAAKLMMTLQTEIKKLEIMPSRVHFTPEKPWFSQGVRRMKVKNFYVYFWIDEGNTKVQVIDVVYVKRDQQQQLRIMPMDFE